MSAAVEEFLIAQRAKRSRNGLSARLTDRSVYTLLDGLLCNRAERGGGDHG